jgi:hypothetical protein
VCAGRRNASGPALAGRLEQTPGGPRTVAISSPQCEQQCSGRKGSCCHQQGRTLELHESKTGFSGGRRSPSTPNHPPCSRRELDVPLPAAPGSVGLVVGAAKCPEAFPRSVPCSSR